MKFSKVKSLISITVISAISFCSITCTTAQNAEIQLPESEKNIKSQPENYLIENLFKNDISEILYDTNNCIESLNAEYEIREIIYHYNDFSLTQKKLTGKIFSFPATLNSDLPKRIELIDVKLKDKSANRFVTIENIIATNIEKKDGIFYPQTVEFKHWVEVQNTKHFGENETTTIITERAQLLNLIHENNKTYPKDMHSNQIEVNSVTKENNFEINYTAKNYNLIDIKKINSKFFSTREEYFGVKSKKTLQELEKKFNLKIHKRYSELVNYFLKSAEANSISTYNDNGSIDFETEIIFNKKAKVYFAINIPDYLNLDSRIANEISEFAKLNLNKDSKEEKNAIFTTSINFLRNNFDLKKADINLEEIPIPLKHLVKNSDLFKEIFKKSKEKSLVDIKLLYRLNEEKYESENSITYNFSTKIDNTFNLNCKSQFEAESSLLDSTIDEIKCSVTGKVVFDNIIKNIAKDLQINVPTLVDILKSKSKETLPQYHLAHNLEAFENFIHFRQGFSLSTKPKGYVTINEIIDFLNAGKFDVIKELNINFKSVSLQYLNNEKKISKNF
ncbi:hypothetical protein [Fluviispira vulneris]|uniref:hypothetical protein n=1 Tax=Fluviispira vulneris TaxID=2763012 RepID=UPI0016444682|nr:hypothetical protein [Fluviispira vulneris]